MKHNIRYITYMMMLVCLAAVLGYFEGSSASTINTTRAAVTSRAK
jgi:hypothetical protein